MDMARTAHWDKPAHRRKRQRTPLLGGAAVALLLAAGTVTASPADPSIQEVASSEPGTLVTRQGSGPMASGPTGHRQKPVGIPETGKRTCTPPIAHLVWPEVQAPRPPDAHASFGRPPVTRMFAADGDWWTPYRRALSLPVWRYRNGDLPQEARAIETNGFVDTGVHGTTPQEHARVRRCPPVWRAPVFTL